MFVYSIKLNTSYLVYCNVQCIPMLLYYIFLSKCLLWVQFPRYCHFIKSFLYVFSPFTSEPHTPDGHHVGVFVFFLDHNCSERKKKKTVKQLPSDFVGATGVFDRPITQDGYEF